MTRIEPGGRAVLFAFDDQSIPWRYRVRLEMHRPEKYDGNPIIARGPMSTVDERRAQNSPVVHDGERFRMWYIARDDGTASTSPGERECYEASRGGRDGISEIGTTSDIVHSYDTGRICCAESDDGFHWRKPDLGIVEYRGSTHNNICDIEPGTGSMDVLFQPDAPPERRYLMVIEFTAWRHLKKPPPLEMPSITRFAASPDGYRWTMLQEEPGVVGQHHEVFCLYRYRDRYHIAGHQASPCCTCLCSVTAPCRTAARAPWWSGGRRTWIAGRWRPATPSSSRCSPPRPTGPAGTARRCTWEPT